MLEVRLTECHSVGFSPNHETSCSQEMVVGIKEVIIFLFSYSHTLSGGRPWTLLTLPPLVLIFQGGQFLGQPQQELVLSFHQRLCRQRSGMLGDGHLLIPDSKIPQDFVTARLTLAFYLVTSLVLLASANRWLPACLVPFSQFSFSTGVHRELTHLPVSQGPVFPPVV